MQFALMTESMLGADYDEALRLAQWALRAGLAAFARSDHYLNDSPPRRSATDVFVTMGGLARETTDIRLAVLVSPITFRHPAVLLKQAVALDQLSGGRFDLGVGTGWLEDEHAVIGIDFPDRNERFERLEEALGYLRAALAPEPTGFTGRYYQLQPETLLPRPTGLRLIVGGGGARRTPRLAGQFADELNHVFNTSAEVMAEHAARARVAATDADRSPGPRFTVLGPAVVARTPAELRRRLDIEAAARNRAPDEILSDYRAKGRPVGLVGEAQECVAALREAGVQQFYVQFFDGTEIERIEDTFDILRS